jgi:hypothetical protein
MKNAIILLLLGLAGRNECRADVKFVNFRKIDPDGRFRAQEQFLLDNLGYYDHWSPDWVYDVAKDSLIGELKTCLRDYERLKTDEFERCLLLGEIAHYLYNFDQRPYYDTAEAFYKEAIRVNSGDCRGYWFLGYAYATSDDIGKGLAAFRQALKLVNDQTGVDFWQEYAFTMEVAGMPFHCQYALDKYKRGGGSSLLSHIMDSTVRSKCRLTDPDISYSSNALWEKQHHGPLVQYQSYPLGVRLEVDSSWDLESKGYANRTTALIIKPPRLSARNGKQIGYTMVLMVKVPEKGERLEDFLATTMQKLSWVRDTVFPFARQFPGGISYSFSDNSIYSEVGGARFRIVGIERPVPAHPGLALEDNMAPVEMGGEPGKLNFFELGLIRVRFPERIFYIFLLDTCDDIREESWKGFEGMMKQVVLD